MLIANVAVFALVVYPLSQKVPPGSRTPTAANAGAADGAKRDYANARATVTGKGQADAELKKFYSDVLPPDLSGARRITYLPHRAAGAGDATCASRRRPRARAEVRDSGARQVDARPQC